MDTSNWISWKYSKTGHFPTWNITSFKWNGVLQHLLVYATVTNDTYSGKGHINLDTLYLAYSDISNWIIWKYSNMEISQLEKSDITSWEMPHLSIFPWNPITDVMLKHTKSLNIRDIPSWKCPISEYFHEV